MLLCEESKGTTEYNIQPKNRGTLGRSTRALERILYANDRQDLFLPCRRRGVRSDESEAGYIPSPRLRDCDVAGRDSSFQLLPSPARVIGLTAFDARVSFLPRCGRSCVDCRLCEKTGIRGDPNDSSYLAIFLRRDAMLTRHSIYDYSATISFSLSFRTSAPPRSRRTFLGYVRPLAEEATLRKSNI